MTRPNAVFWTWQDRGTYELTTAVAACTGSAQNGASQHSSAEGELTGKPPAEEILTIDAQEGKSQFL